MEKRYQVFISSTFSDLKEERKAVIESLLNAKYIPAGMEMFSASNDEQFKYIKKIIDNCDYYILILGARYGSINPNSGISYTEQEYEYAVSKNIPVLAFLHNDPFNLPVDRREDDKRDRIEAFREKVSSNRMCRMWGSTNDLVASVLISLTEEISENPQLGWMRGSSFDAIELLEQLNILRIEKEKLQAKVEKLSKELEMGRAKIDNLANGSDTYEVTGKRYNSYDKRYSSMSVELTWDQIFSAIGPHLVSSINYTQFKSSLKSAINSAYSKSFSDLNGDCVQTIKIQLSALGWIDASPGKSTGGGILEFIKLTKYGSEYLMSLKSIKKRS